MRIFPDDTLQRFEFDRIRRLLEAHCRSPRSKEQALQLVPLSSADEVHLLLLKTHELLGILRIGSFFPQSEFPDITKEIGLLKVAGSTLLEKQVLSLRDLLEVCFTVLRYLADKKAVFPQLHSVFASVTLNSLPITHIDTVLDAQGEVKTSASKELGQIRKNIIEARRELERVFRQHLQKYKKLGWLADTEETVANGRRVLSVAAEHKRNVKGLIQGNSETGKTAFIEPLETVGLNNEVFDLLQQERREVLRILKDLTARLRPFTELFSQALESMVELDFIRAKALLALEMDAVMPTFTGKSSLHLVDARHPILWMQNKAQAKSVVPLTCRLDGQNRLVVISGPNAGGKSIALKTIGLLQLMWQSGLMVPAAVQSELGIFHRFFTDIGDSQSIEYELSTYSSRLLKMKYFLSYADRRTLVLIDEFGTGTDPELGGAVAEAILEELSNAKALGVITTHYMNIKLAAERLNGVQNACMLFDDVTLSPQFKLLIGRPGSSYTYVIAEKSGLPKHVIEQAREKTSSDKLTLDKLLQELQQREEAVKKREGELEEIKRKAEESRNKYEELFARWKAKLEKKNAGAEQEQKLVELGRKFEDWMKEWERSKDKKAIIEKVTRKFNAEKIKKLSKAQEAKKEKKRLQELERKKLVLKVGARVRLLKSRNIGVVEEISGNKAKVLFGSLRTIAAIETLEVVD
ncbi:MAG: endonuclease MutS2 [Bacteroidia bacterium]